MFNNFKISRFTTIGIIFIVMLSILIQRLYQIQILNEGEYSFNQEVQNKKQREIKNTRGNIYDRNGKLLASSRLAYSVTMEDNGEYRTSRERQLTLNSTIFHLLGVLQANNETIHNDLKIKVDEYNNFVFTVEGTQLDRFRADIFGKAKIDELSDEERNATADDIMEYLSNRFSLYGVNKEAYSKEELLEYGLKENYSKIELLHILGIRYMLSLNTYQRYLPITVAKDISENTVTYVLENRFKLQGLDIVIDSVREYEGGEAFAHILGYTGNISSEELKVLGEDNKDYSLSSVVGKIGIEQSMESILQGKDGYEELNVDNLGRVIGEPTKRVEPTPGNDVYLSIDKELQIKTYDILERQLAEVLLDNIINTKEFDKSKVKDASDIKIPIYDVYFALINNNVIDINHFRAKDATDLEREVNQKFINKKNLVMQNLLGELNKKSTPYNRLSKEFQEYESYIVNELLIKKMNILDKNTIDKSDSMYVAWTKEERISLREYLSYAINIGWIDINKIPSAQTYMDIEEACNYLVEEILHQISVDTDFDKKIYKYMLLQDELSSNTICRLLYEQEVLLKNDEDYQLLLGNKINSYEFMRRKIKKVEITPAQLALDPHSGSAVVVDSDTGKILAAVTYPGYDNNRLANKMDSKYYNELNQDMSLPLYNRATQQLTAPGSTFKPITVIAGIKEGVIDYNTSIYCNGVFDKVEPSLRCWKRSGHGQINNIAEALAKSCNVYLSEISYRLGKQNRTFYSEKQALNKIVNYTKMFDLDKKSSIEIAESMPHITDRYAIPSAIGQGTHNFSTVQLARYVNTLSNRGTSYQLSLIDKVVTQEKEEEIKPQVESRVELPENIWDGINVGMKQFAESNRILKEMDINIAGKTGTAQEAKNRPDHALFVGYAPMENPEVTIAVRIANGYSSENAVKVSRDILNYYFD